MTTTLGHTSATHVKVQGVRIQQQRVCHARVGKMLHLTVKLMVKARMWKANNNAYENLQDTIQ